MYSIDRTIIYYLVLCVREKEEAIKRSMLSENNYIVLMILKKNSEVTFNNNIMKIKWKMLSKENSFH